MHLTDTMRVELSLAPALLRLFVLGSLKHDDPARAPLLDLLLEALKEPIADLPERERQKLMRRVKRAVEPINQEHNNQDGSKVLLMGLLWLQARLDASEIILIDGSAFARAADIVIDLLAEDMQHVAQIENSAVKQARRLHGTFQKMGYFR